MALGALEACPDVRLDVLQHVPEMHRAIGVRQGAGYQDLSLFIAHLVMWRQAVQNYMADYGAESGIMS